MTRTQEKADEEAPEHIEHTHASLKTAASMLSQTTQAPSSDDDDGVLTRGSARELPTIMVEELAPEEISLWTCRTIGIPLGGFTLSFLNAVAMGVGYGFFLGYLGLDSYVMSAIQALMKLPEVLLLPLGLMNDCVAICGYHRKAYFVMSFAICACALLLMSLKPLPAPYYCQYPDGSYNYSLPPCNPEAHEGHGWYVGTLVLLNFGIQLGCVAGEGLLLEYAQLEPPERRGTIKAEMTMVNMVGDLAALLVVAFLMNGKEYLGTFTWGLSFCQLMGACCALALALLPITFFCVYEPRKAHPPSLRAHVKASYHLVRQRALASFLTFAFVVQLLVAMSTTAGNMVKSQWAGVKVLQQQLFGMINVGVMMASVWVYKTYFFQCSWRKVFMVSVVAVTAVDALPTFLTIFNVVRDQYFFLGEDVLRGVPMAAISLLSGLLMIEMSEPGREGLCFGLVATLQKSAVPLATVLSNQIFGLFSPSLSDLTNYLADTDSFRRTVALSYLVTFATSLSSLACVPLIPRQKVEAQRRKKDWGTSRHTAKLVILIPAACLVYSVAGLIMASDPHTACSQMAGGQGC